MTWIKICGTTNLEDAQLAVEAGADAVGFVFYEKSPRNINPEKVSEIVAKLPARVEKVGVFVSQEIEKIAKMSERARITAVQFHSSDTDGSKSLIGELMKRLQSRLFVAVPAAKLSSQGGSGFCFSDEFLNRVSALFLDSGTAEQPGGTGKVFDWQRAAGTARALSKGIPIVIAGGLSPSNVTDAIRTLSPWGVDVASGVEAKPGKKDPAKVRAFVQAVRAAEKNN